MGNAQSETGQYGGMAPGARMRLPMPEPEELEKQFNKVLVSFYFEHACWFMPICDQLGTALHFLIGSEV